MAEKKTKAPFGSKTKFVLGLSRELSAKEVVAKGKEQGIQLSEAHVYKIRSAGKGKPKDQSNGKGKEPTAPRGVRTGKGAAPAAAGSSKRDFVLGFGADTTPADILKEAKKAGVTLSKAYVYTIRSSAGATPKRGRKPGATTAAARPSASGGRSTEGQFIDAALDMGLARANVVLENLRARLKQL